MFNPRLQIMYFNVYRICLKFSQAIKIPINMNASLFVSIKESIFKEKNKLWTQIHFPFLRKDNKTINIIYIYINILLNNIYYY